MQRAHEKGVGLLALTDHDTLEGLPEAHQAAARLGIELVNGVELSCTWGGATIHVLGYGFDLDAAPLRQATEALHRGRWARAEEIDRRLAAKGMPGALEGARAIQRALGDSGNAPARPHFAEFLVQGGWVKDRADAFRKWLGAGKLGDVKQHWPTLEEVVGCLREARAGSAWRTRIIMISPGPSAGAWSPTFSRPADTPSRWSMACSRPNRSVPCRSWPASSA